MGMRKAEMEAHHAEYATLMSKARSAQQEGLYRKAIELALSSLVHIDGMMRYERKYQKRKTVAIGAIDLVLNYAPLLLDLPSLDALESFLSNQPRVEKTASGDLANKLVKAKAMMWDAHRMWGQLEQEPSSEDEIARALGDNRHKWGSICEVWARMGLIDRTSEVASGRFTLSTRMGEVVSGKCPSCGGVVEAPKAMFLDRIDCPECKTTVLFTILSRRTANGAKG